MNEKSQKSSADLKADDAFWLTDLYPDAKALLTHQHVPLSKLGDDYVVVLDANVLLLPLETTSESIEAIGAVYKSLANSNQLIVPGQAVREFYKHRSDKIALIADKIKGAIEKAKKPIFDKPISLLEKNKEYQDARALSKEIANKGKEIEKKLLAVNQSLKDDIGEDPVSILYRDTLGNCVCEFELKGRKRLQILKEIEKRGRFQIAPGYKDQKKEDGGIGDYLIWQTILQEANKHKKHCIFVTEEEKPDWWIKRNGTFQPRPELIDEYRRNSNGKSLHLIPLSGLLKKFDAAPKAIEQVQELEKTIRRFNADEYFGVYKNHNIKDFNDQFRRDFSINEYNCKSDYDKIVEIISEKILETIDFANERPDICDEKFIVGRNGNLITINEYIYELKNELLEFELKFKKKRKKN